MKTVVKYDVYLYIYIYYIYIYILLVGVHSCNIFGFQGKSENPIILQTLSSRPRHRYGPIDLLPIELPSYSDLLKGPYQDCCPLIVRLTYFGKGIFKAVGLEGFWATRQVVLVLILVPKPGSLGLQDDGDFGFSLIN